MWKTLLEGKLFHRRPKFSTTFSTGAVENISFGYNNKVTFPHFHRPYYYY
jgi:hypothetical protein